MKKSYSIDLRISKSNLRPHIKFTNFLYKRKKPKEKLGGGAGGGGGSGGGGAG